MRHTCAVRARRSSPFATARWLKGPEAALTEFEKFNQGTLAKPSNDLAGIDVTQLRTENQGPGFRNFDREADDPRPIGDAARNGSVVRQQDCFDWFLFLQADIDANAD